MAVGNFSALKYYYKGDLPIVSVGRQPTKNASGVAEDLQKLVKNHDSLWVVEIRPWETDPKGSVKTALGQLDRLKQHKSFTGVDIYEYTPMEKTFKTVP